MSSWFKAEPLLKVSRPVQWGVLLVLSAVMVALLQWARLPAALLLGPMIAGILLETGGGTVRVPGLPYSFAQAVIGCMIARVLTPQILSTFLAHWVLLLGVMLTIVAASCALGGVISRLGLMPDTTAIWGLLPGAAPVMMLMADAFGADGRLVAFMQYLRVVFVAIIASVVARVWVHASPNAAPVVWFPSVDWPAFLETLILIAASIFIGRKSKIPAGVLLVPMVLGSVLHVTGLMVIELPRWFLALSYALLGWNTGLRFTRKILAHAARTLPQTILAIVLLIGFCGGLGWLLVEAVGIDPLTAYLATSPGGVDSVAIIAASSKVNLPFVMAMQTVRFLIVIVIGPPLSRWTARLVTNTMQPAKTRVIESRPADENTLEP